MIEGRASIRRKPLEKLSTLERLARPPRVTLRSTVVDRTVDDDDVLPEVMGGLRVIATPGHTPGQVSFWQPDRRILFCGDVIAAGGFRFTVLAVRDRRIRRLYAVRLPNVEPEVISEG